MATQDYGILTTSMQKAPPFKGSECLYDICFVMNVKSRGWILDKICRIIGEQSDAVCYYLYSERNDRLSEPLPRSRNYVFAHFALAFFSMKRYPSVFSGNRYVWYTHPDLSKGMSMQDVIDMARACTHVFTPCSINRNELLEHGVPEQQISVPIGGAEPNLFKAKTRDGKGAIGFVGAYYSRKQPELMLELAKLLPHRNFILLGPAPEGVENQKILWHNWSGFPEFEALPNVTYVEAEYEEFPQWYQKFDVLCSTSALEGGPIPAIEAMMSNVVPVLSDTGFARDLIEEGRNGFIFPIDAKAQDIAPLIERAMEMTDVDIAATSSNMSWTAFGQEIWETIWPAPEFGVQQLLDDPTTARYYLRDGFHPPESRGAWMSSKRARLEIPLSDNNEPNALEIFCWAPIMIGKTVSFGATISIGGEIVKAVDVGIIPQRIVVPIKPQPKGERRRILSVEIHLEKIFDPRFAEPEITEKRCLGLKIGWFQVV